MPIRFGVGILVAGALLALATVPSAAFAQAASGDQGFGSAAAPGAAPGAAPQRAANLAGGSSSPAATPSILDINLVQLAHSALFACRVPAAPSGVPDGATAAREQMVAAQASGKVYDTAITNYNRCLDLVSTALTEQFGRFATEAEVRELHSLVAGWHNAAVDQDQALADRINKQIRLYKAKHAS